MIIIKVYFQITDKYLYVLGLGLNNKIYCWERTEGKWVLFKQKK